MFPNKTRTPKPNRDTHQSVAVRKVSIMKEQCYMFLVLVAIIGGLWYLFLNNKAGVEQSKEQDQDNQIPDILTTIPGGIPIFPDIQIVKVGTTFVPEKLGYMSPAESRKWLSDNSYIIERTDTGYVFGTAFTAPPEIFTNSFVNINFGTQVTTELEKGVTLFYSQDKFYIRQKVSE